MLTLTEGFQRIFYIAENHFLHQDYNRTVELRKKYKALVTGEEIDFLLHQFNPREDDILFSQRVRLTQLITPAICNIITSPKRKLTQVRALVNEIGYTGKADNSKNISEIKSAMSNFWGDQSIDDYLLVNFLEREDVDPNAFVIYKFKNFDPNKEKPQVYGIDIPCDWVHDFQYENNILQYLCVGKSITYNKYRRPGTPAKKKPDTSAGRFYQMYTNDWEIEFTQVDAAMLNDKSERNQGKLFRLSGGFASDVIEVVDQTTIKPTEIYYTFTEKKELYQVQFFDIKAGRVPAIRTGYTYDPMTDNRTCVAFYHKAMPYLLKSVKTVSELDLSQSIHVFPQKIEYAPTCLGYYDKEGQEVSCSNGQGPDGKVCQACKGSGILTHTSAQEVIRIRMPKTPEEQFKLSELIHYVTLPIDIVKWLDEYPGGLVTNAVKAVYGNASIIEQSIVKTATEKSYDMESVYDALRPTASHYSRARMLGTRMIAVYKSIDKDLLITYQLPTDLKMQTPTQLTQRLSEAKNAGANQYVVMQLQEDLMDSVYADQPLRLRQYKTMQYFSPFPNLPDADVRAKISAGLVTEYDQVLYTNLASIIRKAEKQDTAFYELTREKQETIISGIVQEIITTLNAERLAKQATMIQPFNQQ